MGFLHRLRVAVWGVPPDTAAEQRLLFKIDFFVLTYVCLMYWVGIINLRYFTALKRLAND
jgi:ACS family pantothenate transporter-like MFS transporter